MTREEIEFEIMMLENRIAELNQEIEEYQQMLEDLEEQNNG